MGHRNVITVYCKSCHSERVVGCTGFFWVGEGVGVHGLFSFSDGKSEKAITEVCRCV